jgi:hypothetical protein
LVSRHQEVYPIRADDVAKKTIHLLSMTFFLSGKVLYKRNHDGTLLRCVDAGEARLIILEVHEGICGTLANGHKIMRSGYYWFTMETEFIEFVQKCYKCQIFAN